MRKEQFSDHFKQEKQSQVVYGPALTSDTIKDLQAIDAEQGFQDGDYDEVLLRVQEENLHQAAIIGIFFDEISRFRRDGSFHLSRRALRVLQEVCGIPCEVIENPKEPDLHLIYDADSVARVVPFPQKQSIYNNRRHERARTARDLL
jgi:hypothetical protein